MRKMLGVLGRLFATSPVSAGDISNFYGVYRGVAPTDESAVAHGELEISITKDLLIYRFATGHNIAEERVATSILRPATQDEVAARYKPGSPVADRTTGFWLNGLMLMFLNNPTENEHGLIIRGNEMADILGLTILMSPKQVERGLFDKWMQFIKDQNGDVLPRLANAGRAAK